MFVSKVAQNDDYALVPSIETYVFLKSLQLFHSQLRYPKQPDTI